MQIMILKTLYLKLQVMSNMNSNFFWSSNYLLVGGRLVGGRWSVGRLENDLWQVVGWSVVLSKLVKYCLQLVFFELFEEKYCTLVKRLIFWGYENYELRVAFKLFAFYIIMICLKAEAVIGRRSSKIVVLKCCFFSLVKALGNACEKFDFTSLFISSSSL